MCGSHLCWRWSDSNTQFKDYILFALLLRLITPYISRTVLSTMCTSRKSKALHCAPPIFAHPIFTDRTGKLTKLYFDDYDVRCNLSDDTQLFVNDFILVFLNGFILRQPTQEKGKHLYRLHQRKSQPLFLRKKNL